MNSFGDISVTFTTLCRYWYCLQVNVMNFVQKSVLEPLCDAFWNGSFFPEVLKVAL